MRARGISFLIVALSSAGPALANDTALHGGRHGPEPIGGGLSGPESVIRMASERLDVVFGRRTTRVVARFVFRNTLPAATATQVVGFPDEGAAAAEASRRGLPVDGADYGGPLLGLRTLVDGRETPAALKYGFVSDAVGGVGWAPGTPKDGRLMAWHAVTVAFPPGRDVVVERRYALGNGTNVLGQSFFQYVTHTGGVWRGPIGELVADVRLVDGLTVESLAWGRRRAEQGPATVPDRGAWRVLGRDRLRLVWRDFEPRIDETRAGFALWTRPTR